MSLNQNDWLKEHYKESGDATSSSTIICKYCPRRFNGINRVKLFVKHLYSEHKKTEMDNHPERDNLMETFNIVKKECTGVCKKCQRTVPFQNGVYLLQNHLELYHSDISSIIYAPLISVEQVREIFQKYIITGTTAKCTQCGYIKELKRQIIDEIVKLYEHSFEHSFEGRHVTDGTAAKLKRDKDKLKKKLQKIEKDVNKELDRKEEKEEFCERELKVQSDLKMINQDLRELQLLEKALQNMIKEKLSQSNKKSDTNQYRPSTSRSGLHEIGNEPSTSGVQLNASKYELSANDSSSEDD